MEPIRLQKYIAQCGIASRREAEKLIEQGLIKVNGKTINSQGVKITPHQDKVTYKDQPIHLRQENIYILLNKPKNYITTKKDTHDRLTITDLLPPEMSHLVPAGRLDKDSTGLLLLSNDGDFIYQITHPKFNLDKEYIVTCKGKLNHNTIKQLEQGVIIENKKTSPAKIANIEYIGPFKSKFHITIHEGRKRQIRLMCESVGHRVLELQRVRIGKIKLAEIKEGKFRHLSPSEIKSLTQNQK